MSIFLLRLLGRSASPDHLISHFSTKSGHFMTYLGERNSSFSANCNSLKALLHVPNVGQYGGQISSITTFLCDAWWDGTVKDKWASFRNPIARL